MTVVVNGPAAGIPSSVSGGALGPYADLAALIAASPAATNAGKTAMVGAAAPYAIYTSNGTGWALTTAAGSFLPTVSTAPYMVFGTRRLIQGYTGPGLQYRSGGGTLTDIPFGGATLEFGSITAAGTVATWYDQSGNARDLTQATVNQQPGISPAATSSGAHLVCFDALGGSGIFKSLAKTSGISISNRAVTVFDVVIPRSSYQTNRYWTMFDAGLTATVLSLAHVSGTAGMTGFGAGSCPRTNVSVFAHRSDATNQKLWLREATFTKTAVASNTIGRLYLGPEAAFQSADGHSSHLAHIVYPAALSDADVATVIASLQSIFSVPTTFSKRLVGDGDSIWEGYLESLNQNTQVLAQYPGVETFNIALGGQLLTTCYANRATIRDTLYTAAYGPGGCVFQIQAGTNDIAGAANGATLYSGTATPYITSAAALGTGASTMISTIISRNFSATPEAERVAYNAAVRTNAAGATRTVDPGGDPLMGTQTAAISTTYFVDAIHPTNAGAARLASIYYLPQFNKV